MDDPDTVLARSRDDLSRRRARRLAVQRRLRAQRRQGDRQATCARRRSDRDYLLAGDYELEVATERVPCRLHLAPLYDPQMTRVKA